MLASTVDNNGRLPNGRFGQNHTVNSGLQKYANRVSILEQEYTPAKLKALLKEPEKLDELPIRDVQILKRLAVTVMDIEPTSRSEIRQELEAHLDRVEGKAAGSESDKPVNVNVNIAIVQQNEAQSMIAEWLKLDYAPA